MSNMQVSSSSEHHIQHAQRPRVIFFGMQGNFSTPSLLALLEHGVEACAVVIPASSVPGREPLPIQRQELPRGRRASLPLLSTATYPSIVHIAEKRHIPVWEVQHLAHETTIATLASYKADAICVACFPRRIPRVIRDLTRFGCLNVHPSLLPDNRGPEPLFWTFREGHESTGVTIHQLDEGMDTGDILLQKAIHVPDGISYVQLESQCAQLGGLLLAKTVWSLYEGTAIRTPQDETKSSYHSFPTDEDTIVRAEEWDAQHVYKFIRGVSLWNGPVTVYAEGRELLVQDAVSYSRENVPAEERDSADGDGAMRVQCRTGWVKVVALS